MPQFAKNNVQIKEWSLPQRHEISDSAAVAQFAARLGGLPPQGGGVGNKQKL